MVVGFDNAILDKIDVFSRVYHDTQAIVIFKDVNSNVIYANPYCLNFLGFQNQEDILGKTDKDFIWRDFSFLYAKGENAALSGESQVSLMPSVDINGNDILFFSTRDIVTDKNKKALGVLSHFRLVKDKASLELSNLLEDILNERKNSSMECLLEIKTNPDELTASEQECLFFLVRGYSAKMIANLISRTKKTVEYHIENLKQKFHVSSKFELIAQAVHEGYFYHIPRSLSNKYLIVK